MIISFPYDASLVTARRTAAPDARWQATTKSWEMTEGDAEAFQLAADEALTREGRTVPVWIGDVRVGMQAAVAYEEDACYPYRGNYKTYSAVASIHTVTVGRRWITRVHKAGLEIVDGHLVLDAERFWTPASPAGVTMFDVAYLVQGRGFTVRLERGVVAVDGNKRRVLAPNIQRAVRAIDRKLVA